MLRLTNNKEKVKKINKTNSTIAVSSMKGQFIYDAYLRRLEKIWKETTISDPKKWTVKIFLPGRGEVVI